MSGKKKRAFVKPLTVAAVALAAIIGLTIFHSFIPFRSLLSAYDLPVRQEGELRIHFVDVGQGDCTIVEFPEGNVLVIDAGDGSWNHTNKLVRYLKGLAPSAVSMLATHADSDHIGGFSALLALFGADTFYLPAVETQSKIYTKLIDGIENAGCQTCTLSRYQTIGDDSGAYAVCLSPYSLGETDENDASVVLYLVYEGVSCVFCGDISSVREKKLVREYALDGTLFDSGNYAVNLAGVDILKVAHHGSAYSSSEEWISLLQPSVSVISCGQGNGYSHPAGEAVARLAQSEIYRTDELGDVMICIRESGYSVYTHFYG